MAGLAFLHAGRLVLVAPFREELQGLRERSAKVVARLRLRKRHKLRRHLHQRAQLALHVEPSGVRHDLVQERVVPLAAQQYRERGVLDARLPLFGERAVFRDHALRAGLLTELPDGVAALRLVDPPVGPERHARQKVVVLEDFRVVARLFADVEAPVLRLVRETHDLVHVRLAVGRLYALEHEHHQRLLDVRADLYAALGRVFAHELLQLRRRAFRVAQPDSVDAMVADDHVAVRQHPDDAVRRDRLHRPDLERIGIRADLLDEGAAFLALVVAVLVAPVVVVGVRGSDDARLHVAHFQPSDELYVAVRQPDAVVPLVGRGCVGRILGCGDGDGGRRDGRGRTRRSCGRRWLFLRRFFLRLRLSLCPVGVGHFYRHRGRRCGTRSRGGLCRNLPKFHAQGAASQFAAQDAVVESFQLVGLAGLWIRHLVGRAELPEDVDDLPRPGVEHLVEAGGNCVGNVVSARVAFHFMRHALVERDFPAVLRDVDAERLCELLHVRVGQRPPNETPKRVEGFVSNGSLRRRRTVADVADAPVRQVDYVVGIDAYLLALGVGQLEHAALAGREAVYARLRTDGLGVPLRVGERGPCHAVAQLRMAGVERLSEAAVRLGHVLRLVHEFGGQVAHAVGYGLLRAVVHPDAAGVDAVFRIGREAAIDVAGQDGLDRRLVDVRERHVQGRPRPRLWRERRSLGLGLEVLRQNFGGLHVHTGGVRDLLDGVAGLRIAPGAPCRRDRLLESVRVLGLSSVLAALPVLLDCGADVHGLLDHVNESGVVVGRAL